MSGDGETRVERDSMGQMEVPVQAYYGASTMRAVLNFPISDLRFSRGFIRTLGLVKSVAAKTNMELGLLDLDIGNAICKAAKEVADGELYDEFVVDIFQTGSGTSTNTNANEVIANRAIEILGGERGSRLVHPNDHVNICQSSNDVIPTVIHLSAMTAIEHELIPNLTRLKDSLGAKSEQFWPIVKTGRTHLQDATPIRLGQEFKGFEGQIERSLSRLSHALSELGEISIGGTAVGTGVNADPGFAPRVCLLLTKLTGLAVHETDNHFQSQNTLDGVVEASGIIRTVALSLYKIANDLRWLSSGPRAGIGEITLPEVQPGSSIMPGKVNPVIPESVIQVIAQVIGNDATIANCNQGGFFELNMMMPVAAYNLLQSISLLATATKNFTDQCVMGIEATSKGPELVEQGLMLGTALSPVVGYDKAAAIAKDAAAKNRSIRESARELTELTDQELDKILDPTTMTEPSDS